MDIDINSSRILNVHDVRVKRNNNKGTIDAKITLNCVDTNGNAFLAFLVFDEKKLYDQDITFNLDHDFSSMPTSTTLSIKIEAPYSIVCG